jgi:hypothetical protein
MHTHTHTHIHTCESIKVSHRSTAAASEKEVRVRTVVRGQVVGEHDDGLARLLGLPDRSPEPGSLFGMPAIRVRCPQLSLSGRSVGCSPPSHTCNTTTSASCHATRVSTAEPRATTYDVAVRARRSWCSRSWCPRLCRTGTRGSGATASSPARAPCALYSNNTSLGEHTEQLTHAHAHTTAVEDNERDRTVVLEEHGAHLQEVEVGYGVAELCDLPVDSVPARHHASSARLACA